MDYDDISYMLSQIKLLGSKGTTGTQASFLELFDGDHEKVKKLDFRGIIFVLGLDYPREMYYNIIL